MVRPLQILKKMENQSTNNMNLSQNVSHDPKPSKNVLIMQADSTSIPCDISKSGNKNENVISPGELEIVEMETDEDEDDCDSPLSTKKVPPLRISLKRLAEEEDSCGRSNKTARTESYDGDDERDATVGKV